MLNKFYSLNLIFNLIIFSSFQNLRADEFIDAEIKKSKFKLAGNKAKNIPEEFRPFAWAQGALEVVKKNVSIPICSVAHIGNGYAITSGHCVIAKKQSTIISNQEENIFFIDWDRGAISGNTWVSVKEIVWARYDDQIDFALLKVRKNFPDVSLDLELDHDIEYGTGLTLFGHPNQSPLTWSGLCNVHYNSVPYNTLYSENYIPHTCHIETGSSGGSLINLESGKVVGVISGTVNQLVDPEQKGIFSKVTVDRIPLGHYAFRLEMLPIEIKDLIRQIIKN